MLYFDRTDVSEEADVNKTCASKDCDICHSWCYLNYSFKFQLNVCNRCHDLLMVSINIGDIAILNIKGSDYDCVTSLISKNEAIKLMQNFFRLEKAEHYKTWKIIIIVIHYTIWNKVVLLVIFYYTMVILFTRNKTPKNTCNSAPMTIYCAVREKSKWKMLNSNNNWHGKV